MNQVVTIMMALIKSVICDEPVGKNIIELITPEVRKELYSLSKAHDLAHLVAYALKKEKAIGEDEISELFSKSIYVAVARYANIVTEQEKICNLLEKHEIPYVPLKGAVIRDYYPEAWMRTSCDIDILIREKDLMKAEKILIDELEYNKESHNYHDVSLYSSTGVHLELHFNIRENEEKIDQMLIRVWEHAKPDKEKGFHYGMEPAFFMFHQVAHMMYHFTHGGCGIRSLVDLWLVEEKIFYEKELFKTYCEKCGIWAFVLNVKGLNDVWFNNENHTGISAKMEKYIALNGVYGTEKSSAMAHKSRDKSRLQYWYRRLFIPYRVLAVSDAKLRQYPILYPYYQVKRWCKLFDSDIRKRVSREIELNKSLDQESVDELKDLFQELEL